MIEECQNILYSFFKKQKNAETQKKTLVEDIDRTFTNEKKKKNLRESTKNK